MTNLLKCDFHCHPLDHKYYPNRNNINADVVLTEDDKRDIEDYIKFCIEERKLDVTAITDHDLIQSSLYAKEYVRRNNLPIKIITGAEVEVYIKDEDYLQLCDGSAYGRYKFKQYNYCHILVLGVNYIPSHDTHMTEIEFKKWADKIRSIGGIVVMSHPLFSQIPFYTIAEHLDGLEIINRDTIEFFEGLEYSENNNLNLKAFTNSDYHFHAKGKQYIPYNVNYETEEFINKLLKI